MPHHDELTLGELAALQERIKRRGIGSLTPDERKAYRTAMRAMRKTVVGSPAVKARVAEQLRQISEAYDATTRAERRRHPNLTPQQVLALRRSRPVTASGRREPRARASRSRRSTVQRRARSLSRSS